MVHEELQRSRGIERRVPAAVLSFGYTFGLN
jgi:hypothetical protein